MDFPAQDVQPNSPYSNGDGEGRISETLMEEVTLGYKPVMPLESLWLSGTDMPQITLRRDLEYMQFHPIVINALEYYKSGIAGAEFWGGPDSANPENDQGKPISLNPQVSQFVLAHVERFWQRGVPLLQEGGYPYGWCPGEHIYKEINGMMTWSHLKNFHPNDGFILSYKYEPIGVRIKNIRSKAPVDMWLGEKTIPAKGCWYAHRPRFNQHYGRSQLIGAWLPWRMLGWRDGMDQVINAAVYRAGYKGPKVRFPPGHSAPTAKGGVPATQTDGGGLSRRENRDVSRQIGEYAKAGATISLSSEVWPGSSVYKWDAEFPDHVMDVRPLIEAAKWAEDRVMLGIGVPPELIRAGGTGSGYSGRSIPREAFLNQQQKVADAMLQMFVEQVLKPLVLWNFGDVPFDVQCKPLLRSMVDDKQGNMPGENPQSAPENFNRSQAMKDSWSKRKIGQLNASEQSQPSSPLSISSKVLSIAERVMRRAA